MKKLFATLLSLTFLVGTMATTAFAAQTVEDGYLNITNVAESQSTDDGMLYTCDDTVTVTITEDIYWLNVYYLTSAGYFDTLDFGATYDVDGSSVFDCSNVTVVVTDTNTTYTMNDYLDGVIAGEVDWYADAYITAGSSFDILLGGTCYGFEAMSLDGTSDHACFVYATYDGTTQEVTEEAVVEEIPDEISFTDVAEEDAFYDAVLWAVEAGVTTGYDDGTFRPDATCTRGQVVTFLYRAAGEPEATADAAFLALTDVAEDSYYYDAVVWAVENGITTGYSDGTFRPNDTCTSAQVITFLHRAQGAPEATDFESELTADVAEAYVSAITWADAISLLEGMDFAADDASPRSDIVTYLHLIDGTVEMA